MLLLRFVSSFFSRYLCVAVFIFCTELPFGFGLNINQIQNSFNITSFDNKVAGGLSTVSCTLTGRIRLLNSFAAFGSVYV